MSDPYADALGIKEPGIKAPEVSRTKIDPALQKSRDGDALDILHQEHEKNQGVYAGATTEEERVRAKADVESSAREIKALGGTPKFYPAPAPLKDPYAAALGVDGPTPATQQSAAPNVAPANNEVQDTRPMTGNKGANQTIASPGFDFIANQATSLGSTIAGGYAGMYKGLKTLIKTGDKDKALSDAVSAIEKTKERGTFEPRTQVGQQMVDGFGSKYNPLQWPGLATQTVGDSAGDALENSGLPAAGAVAKGLGAAAPLALGFKGVQGGLRNLSDLVSKRVPPVELPPATGKYDIVPPTAKPTYKLVNGKPELIDGGIEIPPITPPIQSRNIEAVPTTPDAIRQTAQSNPTKLFPEIPTVAPAGGKFSPSEQLARGKVLESVGMDSTRLRKSALEGDALSGSTDHQTAKLDSPAGRQMRSVIDQEKAALADHSEGLIKDTGGTHGIDQSSLYARGNSIIAPLDGLKKWLDEKTSDLYKAADEKAQGVPTQLSGFKSVLDDASELTNSDRVHLKSSVNAYINKLEMAGEDGSFAGTAKQAETVRKYLNEQWSPQNSKMVGKLKDALDEDVTRSAGEDVYSQARSIRTLRANTLDNPNGIAKIMDSSGPEGINRAVPVEKIADHVTGMPVDQFSHVVNTLKNLPPEMQGQAAGALSEIKAHFANKVNSIGSSQQGQWNAKGVTKYLQNNAGRIAEVFTPEEIAKFRNLNDAGHIVAKDQSYPGAAVQGHNLMTHGVMVGLQGGGAALGSVAGPVGAAIGGYAGRVAASAVGDASAVRTVNKRMVKLSDLAPVK